MEVRLRGAEEERDTLRSDLADSTAGQDVIVRKAWETRDKAVKRKNAAEVELAKERIGVMQVRGCSFSRFGSEMQGLLLRGISFFVLVT